MRKPVHKFIDHLVEGIKTSLPKSKFNSNANPALKQEYGCQQLPPVKLRRFRGNLSELIDCDCDWLIRCHCD